MDRQKEYKSENKMKDCLAYFHLSPVWEKVLKGFREKYISYGRFGGKVILKNLKPTDIEELKIFSQSEKCNGVLRKIQTGAGNKQI